MAPYIENKQRNGTPSTLNISIADLIKNVNPSDSDFLRYVPDEMLDEAQIEAKMEALEKDRQKIESLKKSVAGTRVVDTRDALDSDEKITTNMDEETRYAILKDKKITPILAKENESADIDFEYLEKNIKSVVEKPLISKLRSLGCLTTYKTNVADVVFELTGRGLGKSLHSQTQDYGGNFADFAKVMLNLKELLENSLLVEIHTDKAKGTPLENSQLKQTYVLFSALQEKTHIIPVQFEIKEYVDENNRLYLAVALTKIETSVMGNTMLNENQASTYLLPISNISISEIFSKINPADKNFLKYIPNQFLNDVQIKAKNVALAIEKKKYSGEKKYRSRYKGE